MDWEWRVRLGCSIATIRAGTLTKEATPERGPALARSEDVLGKSSECNMAKQPNGSVVERGDDVAISFLATDERIAEALATRLVGLKVFYFPDRQEDLAGTDGLETMRAPFLTARVNVVLYREQWEKRSGPRWRKPPSRIVALTEVGHH
jgi:hypothetical protein